ncbi:hypothetical protein J6590_045281 [Homalodisca vitripennis]|nr:hypothetical protein J6590_045281 [Homalodisca vitripennis]
MYDIKISTSPTHSREEHCSNNPKVPFTSCPNLLLHNSVRQLLPCRVAEALKVPRITDCHGRRRFANAAIYFFTGCGQTSQHFTGSQALNRRRFPLQFADGILLTLPTVFYTTEWSRVDLFLDLKQTTGTNVHLNTSQAARHSIGDGFRYSSLTESYLPYLQYSTRLNGRASISSSTSNRPQEQMCISKRRSFLVW